MIVFAEKPLLTVVLHYYVSTTLMALTSILNILEVEEVQRMISNGLQHSAR